MTLASLVAAGASLEEVSDNLRRLDIPFEIVPENVEVSGIGALRISVRHPEEQAHRAFRTIRDLIGGADLPERAAARAIEAFRRLAVAEGAVHGVDPDEATFHEVGAVDSIVDVVGSCIALDLLDVSSVTCGPLPMGTGVVESAHGKLPVPGPATLEVLRGSKVVWTDEPRETTTPTGAALMSALTDGRFTDAAPPMTLLSVGYGAGRARLRNTPNLLRAVVGTLEGSADELALLEANVDDAPGEILGAATEKLLAAGAPDAWLEPIFMKRGRGAYKLCALVPTTETDRISRLMMRETGTLGVRHLRVGRTVAERRHVTVDLPYGQCRIKIGSLDGEDFTATPEFFDAKHLADQIGLPLPQIYTDAKAAYEVEKAR